MKASGYSLDLYCDNYTDEKCPHKFTNGAHAEYSTSIGCNTESAAFKKARKDGWKIGAKDFCPTCAKELKK